MKPIEFCGRSLKTMRNFPTPVKRDAGHQLERVLHAFQKKSQKIRKQDIYIAQLALKDAHYRKSS